MTDTPIRKDYFYYRGLAPEKRPGRVAGPLLQLAPPLEGQAFSLFPRPSAIVRWSPTLGAPTLLLRGGPDHTYNPSRGH